MPSILSWSSTGQAPVAEFDAMDTALADLTAGAWSANLATNTASSLLPSSSDVTANSAWANYYSVAPSVSGRIPTPAGSPWAFCGPEYLAGQKKLIAAGAGGHADNVFSGVLTLDLTTLAWTKTDESCLYDNTDNGGAQDATQPFQPGTGTWYPHKRTRDDGTDCYAPIAQHTYGGSVYLPAIDRMLVQGGSAFQPTAGGRGTSGFHLVDTTTGRWTDKSEAKACTKGAGGNCAALALEAFDTGGNSLGTMVFRCAMDGNDNDAYLIDPSDGSTSKTNHYTTVAPSGHMGTLIPDPDNPGHLAYVSWGNNNTQVAIAHKADVWGKAVADVYEGVNWGGTLPTGFAASATWISMHAFKEGSTKIVAFHPVNGLYIIETADWTVTAVAGSTPPYTAPSGDTIPWKRFFFLEDYSSLSGALYFGLIKPNSANGGLYVFPLDPSLV